MISMVGPAGVGKTRLGVQFAEVSAALFPDGVGFVDLTRSRDLEAVPVAMACAFNVLEWRGSTPLESLIQRLGSAQALFVLDNFEHLLEAANAVNELLARCPNACVLVTSREALRLEWERLLPIGPLDLPKPGVVETSVIRGSSAVQLFIERARAVSPQFELNADNAADIAALCAQLDGLPLALELTAARVGLLSPREMLKRLRAGKPLPGNSYASDERHVSLSAALGWSYDLLSVAERRALQCAGVFAGGFTLAAFEGVVGLDRADPLDALAALSDKNLLYATRTAGESRFALLETVRVFALGQLGQAGETVAVQRRHLEYFLNLAETLEPRLGGLEQRALLDALNLEYGNITEALRFATEDRAIKEGLRLATALQMFWRLRGYAPEGRRWLEDLLEMATGGAQKMIAPGLEGRARLALGTLCSVMGDGQMAEGQVERAIALLERADDSSNLGRAILALAVVINPRGDFARARALYERSLRLFEATDNENGAVTALNNLADLDRREGHLVSAQERIERVLPLARRVADASLLGFTLNTYGIVLLERGDLSAARVRLEEALAVRRELGAEHLAAQTLDALGNARAALGDFGGAEAAYLEAIGINRRLGAEYSAAVNLHNLAGLHMKRGQLEQSLATYAESLGLSTKLGAKLLSVASTEGIAQLLTTARRFDTAARLLAFVDVQRRALAFVRPPEIAADVERVGQTLRDALGEVRYAALEAEGLALSLETAVGQATGVRLTPTAPDSPARGSSSGSDATSPNHLSPREHEVLSLAATGLTNKQIGKRLEISERTVRFHVTSVFNKLGVNSRLQAVTEAGRLGLL